MVTTGKGIQSVENPLIRREYKTEVIIIVKSFLKKRIGLFYGTFG